MKKKIIPLLILLVVLAALIAVYFVLSSTVSEGNDNETTEAPARTYTVSKLDVDSVYQFAYTYEGTEYLFRLSDDKTSWTWDGKPSLPISNTKIALMMNYFCNMTSNTVIKSPSEAKLEEYGLNDPEIEIFFNDKNGIHRFSVGMLNTYNSTRYIKPHDSENVYLVNGEFADEYMCGIMDMLKKEETPEASTEDKVVITVEKPDLKLVYTYYPSGNNEHVSSNCKWFVSVNGGTEFPINEKLGEDVSEALKYSVFAKCITYNSDEYSNYGLDSKNTKVTISATGVTKTVDPSTGETSETKSPFEITFYTGNKDKDGFLYAITDASEILYVMTSNTFDELISFDGQKVAEIFSGYVVNAGTKGIESFSLAQNGKEYAFAKDDGWKLNGNTVDEKKVTSLLGALCNLSWTTDVSAEEQTISSPSEVLGFTLSSDKATATVKISSYSDKYYRVTSVANDELLLSIEAVNAILSLLEDATK